MSKLTDQQLSTMRLIERSPKDADGWSTCGEMIYEQLIAPMRDSLVEKDAERLRVDPAMRRVVGGRASWPEKQAASTSEVGRFETDLLSTKRNLMALMDLSGQWIDTVLRLFPELSRKNWADCNL